MYVGFGIICSFRHPLEGLECFPHGKVGGGQYCSSMEVRKRRERKKEGREGTKEKKDKLKW